MQYFLILAIVFLLMIFAPIFTILALNTLFALNIPVTFFTWLSIMWLQMVTFGGVAASVSKK
jgi:hypothetical protein